jgi:hypothetical protein
MPSPGARSLSSLIATMSPILDTSNTYAFATTHEQDSSFLTRVAHHSFEMLFRESEGWTLVGPQATIDALGLDSVFKCKKITLGVHSSLDAVGFMAAITTKLAERGFGVNPVSG